MPDGKPALERDGREAAFSSLVAPGFVFELVNFFSRRRAMPAHPNPPVKRRQARGQKSCSRPPPENERRICTAEAEGI